MSNGKKIVYLKFSVEDQETGKEHFLSNVSCKLDILKEEVLNKMLERLFQEVLRGANELGISDEKASLKTRPTVNFSEKTDIKRCVEVVTEGIGVENE